jgi:hypothetical protein
MNSRRLYIFTINVPTRDAWPVALLYFGMRHQMILATACNDDWQSTQLNNDKDLLQVSTEREISM